MSSSRAHGASDFGELLALQWKHIDFGKRRVLVRRRWYRGTFAPPKSRYGRRDVPLTAGMARSLWQLRKAAGGDEEALVFPSQVGGVLNSANLFLRVYKPASTKAGVPGRPHPPPYVCYHIVPKRHEREAGADVVGPPLPRLHDVDVRPLAAGRSGRCRISRPAHRSDLNFGGCGKRTAVEPGLRNVHGLPAVQRSMCGGAATALPPRNAGAGGATGGATLTTEKGGVLRRRCQA